MRPGPHPKFNRKPLIIFVVMAFTPAVAGLSWYFIHEHNRSLMLERRLTPTAMRVLRSAPSVYAYHLANEGEPTSTTARIAGRPVAQQSAQQDDYYVMRLRKAMLAVGNTSDDAPPCAGPPPLAFQLSDDTSTVTILLNLVCRTLRSIATDASGHVVSEGHASLSLIGCDQIRFLEAEAFQPR